MVSGVGTGWMTTYSGLRFNHENPQADSVSILDIAHHLSMLCSWGGAAREFVSVAQHSVLVSRLCPAPLQRWALLHDSAEAYYGDIIRPLKVLLPEYKALEQRGMQVIARKFWLSWPEPPELKEYDNRARAVECRDLMHSNEAMHDGRGNLIQFDDLPETVLIPQAPREARQAFLDRFDQLWAVMKLTRFQLDAMNAIRVTPAAQNSRRQIAERLGLSDNAHIVNVGHTLVALTKRLLVVRAGGNDTDPLYELTHAGNDELTAAARFGWPAK